MPDNKTIKEWLRQNGYADIADLIDQITNEWKSKGIKTRRNWWDVLAGRKNGTPCTIAGVTFPILKAAQIRKGITVTENALCRNKSEVPPSIVITGRWLGKTNTSL